PGDQRKEIGLDQRGAELVTARGQERRDEQDRGGPGAPRRPRPVSRADRGARAKPVPGGPRLKRLGPGAREDRRTRAAGRLGRNPLGHLGSNALVEGGNGGYLFPVPQVRGPAWFSAPIPHILRHSSVSGQRRRPRTALDPRAHARNASMRRRPRRLATACVGPDVVPIPERPLSVPESDRGCPVGLGSDTPPWGTFLRSPRA